MQISSTINFPLSGAFTICFDMLFFIFIQFNICCFQISLEDSPSIHGLSKKVPLVSWALEIFLLSVIDF